MTLCTFIALFADFPDLQRVELEVSGNSESAMPFSLSLTLWIKRSGKGKEEKSSSPSAMVMVDSRISLEKDRISYRTSAVIEFRREECKTYKTERGMGNSARGDLVVGNCLCLLLFLLLSVAVNKISRRAGQPHFSSTRSHGRSGRRIINQCTSEEGMKNEVRSDRNRVGRCCGKEKLLGIYI